MLTISNKWKAVYAALAGVVAFGGEALADNVVDINEGAGFIAKLIAAGALIYGIVWAAPKNQEAQSNA